MNNCQLNTTKCVNMASNAQCVCLDGYVLPENANPMTNKMCTIGMRIIRISDFVLDTVYIPAWADSTSRAFIVKANAIEQVVKLGLKKHGVNAGVNVISMRSGSTIVEMLINPYDTSEEPQVKAALQKAVDGDDLTDIKANKAKAPQTGAASTDFCKLGFSNCGANEKCVAESSTLYTCVCKDGYVREGGSCVEDNKRRVTIIVTVIVVGVLILIIVLIGIYCHNKRRTGTRNITGDNVRGMEMNSNGNGSGTTQAYENKTYDVSTYDNGDQKFMNIENGGGENIAINNGQERGV